MAPASEQAVLCVPRLAGADDQTTNSQKHVRGICGEVHLRQPSVHTHKQPQAADGSNHESAVCNYKDALCSHIDQCPLSLDGSRKGFQAHLQVYDFTAESKAFMHAHLAHLLHTVRADNRFVAQMLNCPPHVHALLARVPVLAQALYVLCEQANSRQVFHFFVLSVLEHIVLVEDVIASGGTVPNAREQHCARYVQDWIDAVARVDSRHAHSLLA